MTNETPALEDLTKRELLDLCAEHEPPIEADKSMNNDAIMALLRGGEPQEATPLRISEPVLREGADSEPDALTPDGLTLGRIVYYWREERHTGQMKVYPAVVTEVFADEVISLVAWGTPFGSSDWRQSVPKGGPTLSHSWSWPERGEEAGA